MEVANYVLQLAELRASAFNGTQRTIRRQLFAARRAAAGASRSTWQSIVDDDILALLSENWAEVVDDRVRSAFAHQLECGTTANYCVPSAHGRNGSICPSVSPATP